MPPEHTLERAKALVEEAIQCGGQKAEGRHLAGGCQTL